MHDCVAAIRSESEATCCMHVRSLVVPSTSIKCTFVVTVSCVAGVGVMACASCDRLYHFNEDTTNDSASVACSNVRI